MTDLKLGLLVGTALAVLAGSALAQERTLQLGHLANEENTWHKAALRFAEEVETRTDGRIAVEVYPNESLGAEMDLINGMQLGTADMTITGVSLQNWAPMASLLALPYVAEAARLIDSGAIDVSPIITHSFPPDALEEAFTVAADRSRSVKTQLAFT